MPSNSGGECGYKNSAGTKAAEADPQAVNHARGALRLALVWRCHKSQSGARDLMTLSDAVFGPFRGRMKA
jgi:hypothetical protein